MHISGGVSRSPQPAPEGRRRGLAAFGLGLLTDLEPPGCWQARVLTEPTLCLRAATASQIAEHWSGLDALGWQGTVDGAPFVAELGQAGDLRFVHGEHPCEDGAFAPRTRAVHHLSAEASVLSCAAADPSEPSWWRVVLDSALFTVALAHGYEALHAAAVATPNRGAIAIAAPSGGGKSTLLSGLLGEGLALIADDVLVLEPSPNGGPPLAHPAPPLMSVPSVRLPSLARAVSSPEPICSLGQERWIAVPVHRGPLPLHAFVQLDRRPGAQLSLAKIEHPLVPLMSSLMSFPRTSERERKRFELASVIATTSSMWRLSADLRTPAEVLAEALLHGLELKPLAGTHIPATSSRC